MEMEIEIEYHSFEGPAEEAMQKYRDWHKTADIIRTADGVFFEHVSIESSKSVYSSGNIIIHVIAKVANSGGKNGI